MEDIQKDALALLPILQTLEEARAAGTLRTFPKIASNIERAFTLGITTYLTALTDQDQLVGYVRQNDTKYRG